MSNASLMRMAGASPWLRLAGLALLSNLPFWILGFWFTIDRAVLNLDLLVAALALSLSRRLAMAGFIAAWVVDAVVGQSVTYHFLSPLDFVRSAMFADTLDWGAFAFTAKTGLLVLFGIVAVLLWRLCAEPLGTWRVLVVLVAAIVLDALSGASLLAWRDTRWGANLAGSPTATLLHQSTRPGEARVLRPLPAHEGGEWHDELLAWARVRPQASVLVVVVESMGLPVDPAIHEWTRRQLWQGDLTRSHALREWRAPFRGATTSGELRVLCGVTGSYRALSPQSARACLPNRFGEFGWHTVGLHGFSSRMFERRDWWPAMGLREMAFGEELLRGRPLCGAGLRGVCDHDLLDEAVARLRQPQRFVYVLTLNTHLPLVRAEIPPDLAALCSAAAIEEEVCLLQAQVGRLLAGLRERIAGVDREMAVVVVGDHAPPFSHRRSRASYETAVVPSFAIYPRAAASAPGP
jgi:hypothetical protein